MKLVTTTLRLIALSVMIHAQEEMESFDCLDDETGVIGKGTCDVWCGGVGAYQSYQSQRENTNVQEITKIDCECTDKNNATAPPATKTCSSDVEWENCYDDSINVTDKESCDAWCNTDANGSVGSHTGYFSGDTKTGDECECTDKNDPGAPPAVIKCTGKLDASSSSIVTIGGVSVLALLAVLAAM